MRGWAKIDCSRGYVEYRDYKGMRAVFNSLDMAVLTALASFPSTPTRVGLINYNMPVGDIKIVGECVAKNPITLNVVDVRIIGNSIIRCETLPCINIPSVNDPIQRRSYAPSSVIIRGLSIVYEGGTSYQPIIANYGAKDFEMINVSVDGGREAGFGVTATPVKSVRSLISGISIRNTTYAGLILASRPGSVTSDLEISGISNTSGNGTGLMISAYSGGSISDIDIKKCDIGIGVYSSSKDIVVSGVSLYRNDIMLKNNSRYKIIINGAVVVGTIASSDDIINPAKAMVVGPGFENYGTATFTGDGTTTVFNIPHGLVSVPRLFVVMPVGDTPKDFTVTADSTNITITYATAPTGTLTFTYFARV